MLGSCTASGVGVWHGQSAALKKGKYWNILKWIVDLILMGYGFMLWGIQYVCALGLLANIRLEEI